MGYNRRYLGSTSVSKDQEFEAVVGTGLTKLDSRSLEKHNLVKSFIYMMEVVSSRMTPPSSTGNKSSQNGLMV